MSEWINSLSKDEKELLVKKEMPEWVEPMLATLTHKEPPESDEWVFERKLDGERIITYKKRKRSELMTRNRKEASDNYPEIISALRKQSANKFIIDGEVVAFSKGVTDFQQLQQRMHSEEPDENIKVHYYIFDLIYYDGYDLQGLPLVARKKILKQIIDFKDPLVMTQYQKKEYFNEACDKGWEGLIAKQLRSKYYNSRSKKWLKLKCFNQQEFVIGGYTEPQGNRTGFGALLVGYYDDDKLMYAGKVGTGYSDETLEELSNELSDLRIDESPFSEKVKGQEISFVKPELVCEVKFSEWTRNDRLRQPSFKGLRRDKKPKEVKKE